jgi:hypothetical protein
MRMARALDGEAAHGEAGIATRGKMAQVDFDKVREKERADDRREQCT